MHINYQLKSDNITLVDLTPLEILEHFGDDPEFQHNEEFLKKSSTDVIPWFPQMEGNKQFDIVLPSMPIKDEEDNKSLVKTIFSKNGKIIYFSREKVPYNYNSKKVTYYKNLSIISFKPKALQKFFNTKIGKLEKIEGIELMRALEIGLNIGTFIINGSDFAVDVNADLLKAINVMPKDKFRKLY